MSDCKDKTTLKTGELECPVQHSAFEVDRETGNAEPAAQLKCQKMSDDTVVPFRHHMLIVSSTTVGTLRIELGAQKPFGYEQIDAFLPYDGVRGMVHRSTWVKTGMFVASTEEDEGLPRPVGHESALKRATAISALIHHNTFGLKSQPRKVYFKQPVAEVKSNTLDYLVTLKPAKRSTSSSRTKRLLADRRQL